ncbi:MAG: DUF5615 family PIN-like protein [Dehalococcoidia bacterium]|nr:DUF5615 family PIN-like protein [Dehalococcoidia bacterium]
MPLRLYTDNDSGRKALCDALALRGIEVLRTEDAGNRLLADDDQLQFATARGLVIYSANYGDFARIHKRWMEAGRTHAGIVVRVQQQVDIGTELRALMAVADGFAAGELANQLVYLDQWFRR